MEVFILMQVVQERADYETRYLDSIYDNHDDAADAAEVAHKLSLNNNTVYEIEVHSVIEKSN